MSDRLRELDGCGFRVQSGSDVVGWAAADLQMVIEVGEAFSCWLLSVTVGEGLDLYSEMHRRHNY